MNQPRRIAGSLRSRTSSPSIIVVNRASAMTSRVRAPKAVARGHARRWEKAPSCRPREIETGRPYRSGPPPGRDELPPQATAKTPNAAPPPGAPSEDEKRDLLFAWTVAKYVKSNAIVYARNRQTVGVGAGQMSRVYSAKIAGIKAEDENLVVPGSVMASDAFFPFRDGIDAAAEAGITAVIQPGGSVRDEEVIQAANEAGMAMMFTSMRHFRH